MQTALASEARNFADIARGFCSWCEGPLLSDGAHLRAGYWLASLHAAALGLPDVAADDEQGSLDQIEDAPVPVLRNVAQFDAMFYRQFFDPAPTASAAPSVADIGDDLRDVYLDVRAGLQMFELGKVNEAVWHWGFSHRAHWGRHAVGALFALHCMDIS